MEKAIDNEKASNARRIADAIGLCKLLCKFQSNNSYQCGKFPPSYSRDDPEACNGVVVEAAENSSYDVSFDGDKDPMNPRSMPFAHKWAIVIIVCMGTLCVSVIPVLGQAIPQYV